MTRPSASGAFVEQGPESLLGSMQSYPGGRLGNVESRCDLGVRPALLVSQRDQQALAVAEPLERAGDVQTDHGSIGLVKGLFVGDV
jgi:hypothetical protein